MMEGKDPKRRGRPHYLQGLDANPSPGAMSGISHPGMNDVMFGRGGDTNYHIGNNSFRHLVETYREKYWAASNRKEKSQIIAAIIGGWRTQDPPGRFLAKTDPDKGDESTWHDVGDQVAGRKASKILSEMRIGKKKKAAAAAKRAASKSPHATPERKDTDSPEYIRDAIAGIRSEVAGLPSRFAEPMPALSGGRLREMPTSTPAPSYSEVGATSFMAPPEETSSSGMMGLSLFGESFMQSSNELQRPSAIPALSQQLGDNMPTAQALTEVFQDHPAPAFSGIFQDQFISNADMTRMMQAPGSYPSHAFDSDDSDH